MLLKNLITDTKPFLATYIILCLGATYIQFTNAQDSLSYLINGFHNKAIDLSCKYGTHLGDGLFFLAVACIIFFYNRKAAVVFIITYALSSLLAQGFKHFVFSDSLRPAMMLDLSRVHVVEGVEIRNYHSFPSGHTTSAFALFGLISFYVKNKLMKVACIIPALIVAYSRIYLLQHFFEDTLFGSLLGVISALMVYYILNRIYSKNDV